MFCNIIVVPEAAMFVTSGRRPRRTKFLAESPGEKKSNPALLASNSRISNVSWAQPFWSGKSHTHAHKKKLLNESGRRAKGFLVWSHDFDAVAAHHLAAMYTLWKGSPGRCGRRWWCAKSGEFVAFVFRGSPHWNVASEYGLLSLTCHFIWDARLSFPDTV